ncbi:MULTISPECIES: hypothetical protein [Cellvibrio]|uniref:Uncharacterized protein n=1 Tax=Cellvibrio fibrivorans TaxID=126350 RepID=A0ABU1US67_9GAMM|nr:hypothetical protein [Cellvibrio fibrivorans]MDR7088032.1 hypothetical protein [Cellvibrio fibrivorans]
MKTKAIIFMLFCVLVNPAQAFSLGDLKDNIDRSHKCKSGDQGCKNREHLKAVARVAAVAVAVTVLTKMIIKHRSERIAKEEQVAEEYKAQNNNLPTEPTATEYTTKTLPGNVVEPGKEVIIQSDIVVVPGTKQKTALIEESIVIYDNEDNTKELKNFTKPVNEKTKKGGRYQNEFSFTLPEGLPQGVYPIKTELLLNGKVVDTSNNDIQLVLHVNELGAMQLLAMN